MTNSVDLYTIHDIDEYKNLETVMKEKSMFDSSHREENPLAERFSEGWQAEGSSGASIGKSSSMELGSTYRRIPPL